MAALIVRVRHRRLVVREAARVGQIPNGPDHLPDRSGSRRWRPKRGAACLCRAPCALAWVRAELCVCSSRLGVTCHREEVVVVHRCGNVRVIPGPPRAWACTAAGRLARPPSGIGLALDSQSDGAVGWSPPGSAPDEVILRDVELPLGLDVERESKLGQHCVPLLLSCPDVLRTNQER